VCKAVNKHTKLTRAIKSILKERVSKRQRLESEIALMKEADHPNIIRLYEVYEDARFIYLVMELCEGGELFDQIIELATFTETQAACVMKQILSGLFYLHERDIVHRDIKPENFLFVHKEDVEKTPLKFIDFGLARTAKGDSAMKSRVGTAYYMAPEVIQQNYTRSADLWSVGVIMYILLSGNAPFSGDTDKEILQSVAHSELSFEGFPEVSDEGVDLILKMIERDPTQRITAEKALQHPWIAREAPAANQRPIAGPVLQNLKRFCSGNSLRKAALQIIAGKLSEREIEQLKETFVGLDTNGDGVLSAAEIRSGFERASMEVPKDLEKLIDQLDTNHSGGVDYTEFLAASLDAKIAQQESVAWSAFRVFDQDGDGKITVDELRKVLGAKEVQDLAGDKSFDDLVGAVDTNNDGVIDFQEFMAMLGAGPARPTAPAPEPEQDSPPAEAARTASTASKLSDRRSSSGNFASCAVM